MPHTDVAVCVDDLLVRQYPVRDHDIEDGPL